MSTQTYDRHAIGREMKRQGVGPRELGRRAHMTSQAISYIARAMVDPKVTTLVKVARALRIDVRALFVTRN